MLQRFRSFLELQFRDIVPNRESEEYKEELLSSLIDRANAMKEEGETDEDVIYHTCIEKLGDFKENFNSFKKVPKIKKAARLTLNILAIAAVYTLIVLAAFLIVSFTVGPWSKTWLIIVCGALLGIAALFIYLCVIARLTKHFGAMRFLVALILTLSVLITFLIFSVLENAWSISWLLFLFLPILLTGADLICTISVESKRAIASLVTFIMVACTLVYVILGITGYLAWHPCWLIPVVAAIVDVIIIIVAIRVRTVRSNRK